MNMNDNEFGAVFALAIGTLFFASVTLCIRTGYKKKYDSFKGTCCWDCITYETTRDVKVEEDIELGKKKPSIGFGSGSNLTPSGFGGSTETNSEFNSEFNSESKRI